jgi:hypothetical protein
MLEYAHVGREVRQPRPSRPRVTEYVAQSGHEAPGMRSS